MTSKTRGISLVAEWLLLPKIKERSDYNF